MKALLIGGTGIISTAITRSLCEQGCELTVFNRGSNNALLPREVNVISGNIHDEEATAKLLENQCFDVVADFIAFTPEQAERDYRLFREKTNQFIFISSASAYQKPPVSPIIDESTPLANPYWEYSRNKAACEDILMELFRLKGFPVTIVRPSHTYGDTSVPLALHGKNGPWQVLRRMQLGKPIITHGDGTSLWTVTHNTDFARGFIGLMGNPHAIGQAVHITSDEHLTWNQIHEIVARQLGTKYSPCYVPSNLIAEAGKKYGYDFEGALLGDKSNSVIFDNSKLKRLVPGFTATVRFDQGMAQTIPHILSHPELQTEDAEFDAFSDELCKAMQAARNF